MFLKLLQEIRAKPRDRKGIMIEQNDKIKVLRKIETKYSDLTQLQCDISSVKFLEKLLRIERQIRLQVFES